MCIRWYTYEHNRTHVAVHKYEPFSIFAPPFNPLFSLCRKFNFSTSADFAKRRSVVDGSASMSFTAPPLRPESLCVTLLHSQSHYQDEKQWNGDKRGGQLFTAGIYWLGKYLLTVVNCEYKTNLIWFCKEQNVEWEGGLWSSINK